MVEYCKIDKQLVEHIALISRLNLTEDEKTLYTKQLGEIIDSFKMLDELDNTIKDEQPAFHAIEFGNVWREDNPTKTDWDPLSNSLKKEGGYFQGPKII